MRWASLMLFGLMLSLCAGVRNSSADIEYWFDFEPIGTMGGPIYLDVDWPTEPTEGFDWRSGIYISANIDDHDHMDVYEVDTATSNWVWLGPMSAPGSPEITWTCSWGVFEESSDDTAVGYAGVTWRPTEPFQDTVEIDVEVDDPYDTLIDFEMGDRDDAPESDSEVLRVRWPKTINVSHRRRDANDPPLDMGFVFGYYNVVEILDNFGQPYPGIEVQGDMADIATFNAPRNNHGDSTPEGNINWLSDVNGTTDSNGLIRRFDLVQGPLTEAQLQTDSPHIHKRAYVVARANVKKRYWNPFPNCTGTHTNQYVNGVPP